MQAIVQMLKEASNAYYLYDNPIMTDKQYDDLLDKLKKMEEETGIILAGSPTQQVQGGVLDGFEKVQHSKPMLSADKTKEISEIKKFVYGYKFYGSFKLDGLTLVVRYKDGKFVQGVTRGNGTIGEDVTENCKFINDLPMKIPYTGELELRGEAVISWQEFYRINHGLEKPYSHPRNLAAGTIRNLDQKIVKDRNISYQVFECVTDLGINSKYDLLTKIEKMGFQTVMRVPVGETVERIVEILDPNEPMDYKYPVDGIIFEIDHRDISKSMGATGHHECCRMALKWEDELYSTFLRDVEWNTTRTGVINPVAIFDEVDLDGALTTRATLHNVSYIKDLKLGIGDEIKVYRANMVIPKVHESVTKSGTLEIPDRCPACGGKAVIKKVSDSEALYCENPTCKAKLLDRLVHFCSRNAMDIRGLSEQTLEKFMERGWLTCFEDIYKLKDHQDRMKVMEGFREKSVNNLLVAIEESRKTDLHRFIYALGIPLIGRTASKEIGKYFKGRYDNFYNALCEKFDWTQLPDFGKTMASALHGCVDDGFTEEINRLAKYFEFNRVRTSSESSEKLAGKTFCITGTLEKFNNRDEMKTKIEELGGKVTGSVTSKTNYLINNDLESSSSKNKKAKELGIPIITEIDLLEMID